MSIASRAEDSNTGKRVACFRAEVRPGGTFLGWTYEELRTLGNGTHEIEPKPGWKPGVAPPQG